MDEDIPQEEDEKPRFILLPEGCKDLIDALRPRDQQRKAPKLAHPQVSFSATEPLQELPSSVTLPDPVSLLDLASALHIKPYKIFSPLIRLKIFVSLNAQLDFDTASKVCSHYGVAATKMA